MQIGKKILGSIYLWPEQKAALEKLAAEKGRAQQEILREGLDLVLRKYGIKVKERKGG